MVIDKETLLKGRLPEAEVEIPGVGTVRVRALSRGEVFGVQQLKGVAVIERRVLHLGMIDPVMTEAEVQQWQDASPAGELEPVGGKIRELSGLGDDADKSGVPANGDEPGDGV
jgi:hypothetical protein